MARIKKDKKEKATKSQKGSRKAPATSARGVPVPKLRASLSRPSGAVPLAVVSLLDRVAMLSRAGGKTAPTLSISWSADGVDFVPDKGKIVLETLSGKKEKIKNCRNFCLSESDSGFLLIYERVGKTKSQSLVVAAKSKDLNKWKAVSEMPTGDSGRVALAQDTRSGQFEIYGDGLFVKNQSSENLRDWNEPTLLFTSRPGMFDSEKISLLGALSTERGILLLYDASVRQKSEVLLQVGGVLFDQNDPRHIIWRSPSPLWQGVVELKKSAEINSIGFVQFKEQFFVYWADEKGELIVGSFPSLFKSVEIHQYKILKKFEKNPILKARPGHDWEAQGTFNPAVFQDDDQTMHLFYRAVGSDGISRVGYAKSDDGMHFIRTLSRPVFEPSRGFGMPDEKTTMEPIGYNPAYYTSGGGWGGSEDPKVVKIGERVYMLYVAFEGWNSMRIALTSISIADFRAGKWNWKKPVLISPPNKMNKNWVLFPEKIGGKFAILHSIAPKVSVEYIDDLDNLKGFVDSPRLEGPQPGRSGSWDNFLRGAGAPPIKTDIGWLLLYHAIDKRETHKYKLGAMILDLQDPTKVLYRSEHPILYPEMWYENDGKPGVVYASGAAIVGDNLFVYYGGGDKVVCLAETPLRDFLNYLQTGKPDLYEMSKVFIPVL